MKCIRAIPIGILLLLYVPFLFSSAPAGEMMAPERIEEIVRERYPFFESSFASRTHYQEAEWPNPDEFSLDLKADASIEEVREELTKAAASLQDGHTSLPPRRLGEYPGIRLRFFASEGIFVEEHIGEDELKAGDRILAVEGVDQRGSPVTKSNWEELFVEAKRYIPASSIETRRQYAANSIIAVAVRDTEYAYLGFRIEREGKEHTCYVKKRSLADGFDRITGVDRREITYKGSHISYMTIPTMGYLDDIDRLDRMIHASLDSDGIILDLRGNSGGNSAVSDYLIARFGLTESFSFRIIDGTSGETLRYIGPPSPRGRQYNGPVAVLIDHHVFSAANHFVALCWYVNEIGARDIPFLLVGGRSAGGSGIAEMIPLGNGISLRLTTSVMTDPQGIHYERGILPDIDVLGELTPEDLRKEPVLRPVTSEEFSHFWRRDPVIHSALEHLEENL